MNNYIIFNLDDFSYGLNLDNVEKITYSVAVTPLPAAPPSLLGVVNYQGDYIPVLNIRKKCGVPFKSVELSDNLIIIRNSASRFAIIVDSLSETFSFRNDEIIPPESVWEGLTYLKGIFRHNEKTVFLIDDTEILRSEEKEFVSAGLNINSADEQA